ncbi:hypothetical protein [Thiothrix unzii]|uniref:Uncharacterized protein n=1 Tax=Thiothrix unzii TaxID=111769 RepID=A0A975IIP3_9GAMM|nr:hypothetical protein [Thiothrix unzii]QTR55386.1 hypothetical protein J9260_17895 [Thiothrix unzii]
MNKKHTKQVLWGCAFSVVDGVGEKFPLCAFIYLQYLYIYEAFFLFIINTLYRKLLQKAGQLLQKAGQLLQKAGQLLQKAGQLLQKAGQLLQKAGQLLQIFDKK